MAEFIGDCVEAVLNEVLADEDTAIVVGVPLLILIAPFYVLWAYWPRKKPLEFEP